MSDTMVPLATFHAYDMDEIERYSHATGYMMILYEIEQKLRANWKYNDIPEAVYEYVEKLREQIASWKSKYHLPE